MCMCNQSDHNTFTMCVQFDFVLFEDVICMYTVYTYTHIESLGDQSLHKQTTGGTEHNILPFGIQVVTNLIFIWVYIKNEVFPLLF